MANVYVDYTAANDGDGTTAAQAAGAGLTGAFNTLAGKTFTAGDKVWVRRVASSAIGATTTLSQTVGVEIIGWPKSGDVYYSTRPASGTSNGWDSDSADYFTLLYNSASFNLSVSGQNYTFYRLKVQQNASAAIVGSVTGSTNIFIDCYWLHNHATPNTANPEITLNSTNTKFIRCKFEASASSNAGTGVVTVTTATGMKLFDCIVQVASIIGTSSIPFNITASDCTIHGLTVNIVTGTSVMNLITVSGSNCVIMDTAIVASGGVTSFSPFRITGSNNRITGITTNSGGGGSNGFVSITGNHNVVMFTKCTQNPTTGTNGINLTTGAGNHVVLKNVVFQGNTQDLQMGSAANNMVYCNNCTFSSSPIISSSMHETCSVYSYNHNTTSGLFHAEFLNGTIDSSATYRTGGETFSFKFQSSSAGLGERGQLQLGIPGMETIWIALAAGSRTLTLYGAHKNFSSNTPTKQTMWFEFEYLDASGNYTHVSTYAYGTALDSDASTWNGDTGLTAFKIQAPSVTVNADCVVSVRVFYHTYESGAYTYVDPKIVVT